jgi:hypothetical protein
MSGGGQIHCRGQATSGDLASAALTVTCDTAMSWCSCTAAAMALTMRVSQTLVFVTYVSDMFCTAGYNARRQRVLKGKTPNLVVAERLTAKPALAKAKPAGRARSCDITKARLIAESEGSVTT